MQAIGGAAKHLIVLVVGSWYECVCVSVHGMFSSLVVPTFYEQYKKNNDNDK